MTEFKINDKITIRCIVYNTRYSWGHKSVLNIDGEDVLDSKITYYNRTWEPWEFASMISYTADRGLKKKLLTKEDYQAIMDYRQNRRG